METQGAVVKILTSEKEKSNPKPLNVQKEHLLILTSTINNEDVTYLNIYAQSNTMITFMKQIRTEYARHK